MKPWQAPEWDKLSSEERVDAMRRWYVAKLAYYQSAHKDANKVRVVSDNVTLPHHYARFAIEPVRFCAENKLDVFQASVVQYVCRHDAKNGIEDIVKAIRYLEMYREYLKGNPNWWTADFKAPMTPEEKGEVPDGTYPMGTILAQAPPFESWSEMTKAERHLYVR